MATLQQPVQSIHHTVNLFKPYWSCETKLPASPVFPTLTRRIILCFSFVRHCFPSINPCEIFPGTFLCFSIFSLPRYLDQLSCENSANKQIFLKCLPKCQYCICVQSYGIKSVYQFMLNLLYLFPKSLSAYDLPLPPHLKPQDSTCLVDNSNNKKNTWERDSISTRPKESFGSMINFCPNYICISYNKTMNQIW